MALEGQPFERFREDVGCVIVRWAVVELDKLLLDDISDEVMPNIDVFCAIVVNWVFGEADRRLVVGKDVCRSFQIEADFQEKLFDTTVPPSLPALLPYILLP